MLLVANVTLYQKYLLYHESVHFIVALPVCYICYRWFGKKTIWIVFLTTYLVDIDHLFFLLCEGVRITGIKMRLENGGIFGDSTPFLILHGFDLAVILIIIGYYWKKYKWLFTPIGLSLFYHLVVDMVSYFEKDILPWEYVIILKWLL